MSSTAPGPAAADDGGAGTGPRPFGVIRDTKDFWSSVMCMGFAVAAVVLGRKYDVGTPASMGPGMFPRVLGSILGGLGLLLSLRAMRPGKAVARIEAFQARPVLVILGSVVVYGLVLAKLGIVVASMLLVFISRLAAPGFRWVEVTVFGAIMTLGCVLVFVTFLQLPVPVWPVFLGG